MKKTILFVLVLFPFVTNAQNEPLLFTSVVKVDSNVLREELFDRAKIWFAESYNSSQKVVQLSDKEAGIIEGKALFKYVSKNNGVIGAQDEVVKYSIKVMVKNGRYKYEIADFESNLYSTVTSGHDLPQRYNNITIGRGYHQRHWNELQKECESHATFLAASLSEGMEKRSPQKDDW